MKKSFVKVHYLRLSIIGIPLPFFHTFLEIKHKKRIFIGFRNKNSGTVEYLTSLVEYDYGITKKEKIVKDSGILLTTNPKKIKKLLSLLPKYKWTKYHALFHNCFHWRNAILKEANIEIPNDSWFRKAKAFPS